MACHGKKKHTRNKKVQRKKTRSKKHRSERVEAYTWGEAMESKNKHWPY